MRASEAFAMPRFTLVCHSAGRNYLIAFDASRSEFLFIATSAVDFLVFRDETLRTDWSFTYAASEAFLVPLALLIFHLLVTCSEDFSASITTSCELSVVARTAIYPFHFGAKLFVYEGHLTFVAEEAFFMPMLILVRQILGINANDQIAVFTSVGKNCFITFNTIRMFIFQDVTLSSKTVITLPAAEVPRVPVL